MGLPLAQAARLVAGERGLDADGGERRLPKNEASFEPQDAIAEPGEDAVATGVGLGAVAVAVAIDFEDQAGRGSEKVSDETAGEGDLAARWHAGEGDLAARWHADAVATCRREL